MKEKILVIGGGGFSKVVIGLLKRMDCYDIIGFLDKEKKDSILGICNLGTDDYLDEIDNLNILNAVLGVGQVKTATMRRKIQAKISKKGLKFPAIVSQSSIINDNVTVKQGALVMDGVIINPYSMIGDYCIINTKSFISHDCNIGVFTHIGPGSVICGGASVGENCTVGAGSTVIQGITIVNDVIIGAGSVVVKDILNPGVYAGNPARLIE